MKKHKVRVRKVDGIWLKEQAEEIVEHASESYLELKKYHEELKAFDAHFDHQIERFIDESICSSETDASYDITIACRGKAITLWFNADTANAIQTLIKEQIKELEVR